MRLRAVSRDEADLAIQIADLKGGRYTIIRVGGKTNPDTLVKTFWLLMEAKGLRDQANRWILMFMARNRIPGSANWWTGTRHTWGEP